MTILTATQQPKNALPARPVRSVKHPYPDAQVPVRGKFRVACLMLGSTALINVRRIQRYLLNKMEAEKNQKEAQSNQNAIPKTSIDTQAIYLNILLTHLPIFQPKFS